MLCFSIYKCKEFCLEVQIECLKFLIYYDDYSMSLKTKLNAKKEQQSDINFFKQEMTRVIFELIICKLTLLDFNANKYIQE